MRGRRQRVAAVVLALAGCGGPAIRAVGPQTVRHAAPGTIRGPHVPAGSTLVARLEHSIDTLRSRPGEVFTARVTSALRDREGRVVVPAGARLRGRVSSVGGTLEPELRLRFEWVETTRGLAGLAVAIRSAEHTRYEGPVVYRPQWGPGTWNGTFWTPHEPYGSMGFYGNSPPRFSYAPYQLMGLYLPAGAELRLVLTRPLVPPGTEVRAP